MLTTHTQRLRPLCGHTAWERASSNSDVSPWTLGYQPGPLLHYPPRPRAGAHLPSQNAATCARVWHKGANKTSRLPNDFQVRGDSWVQAWNKRLADTLEQRALWDLRSNRSESEAWEEKTRRGRVPSLQTIRYVYFAEEEVRARIG